MVVYFFAVVVILVDQFPLEMAILVALNNFFGDNRYWVYLPMRKV